MYLAYEFADQNISDHSYRSLIFLCRLKYCISHDLEHFLVEFSNQKFFFLNFKKIGFFTNIRQKIAIIRLKK